MRAVLAMLVVAALGLGGVVASAADDGSPARAESRAAVASGSIGPQHEATAAGRESETRSGPVQTQALTIRDGEAATRSNDEGDPIARAVAVARSVNALDGLVTAYGVRRQVSADGDGRVYEGKVLGLRIDGEAVGDVAEPRRFDLPDGAGFVDVNVGDTGLRVRLEKPAGGQPGGTDLHVAVVDAVARRARAPESTPEPRTGDRKPRAEKSKSKRRKASRPARRKVPASVPPPSRLSRGGYAFPVYGEGVSIADDFGGPRQIGPHQGNDIFAPFGSPVLAVADGTLQKVGTLPISGNRLWLVTDDGDAFFYAHLASFSELAETGRRVRAGEVLGFVGNTGDAEPTPPHVHFEIHPRGIEGPAADPHSILLAWQQREDVAPSAWLRRVGTDTTERPGALVEVRDFIAGE